MDDEKVIELAENILKNYDSEKNGRLIAQAHILNDQFTMLVYGVQNNLISERFTLGDGGLFIDGKPIVPIPEKP